MKKTIINIVFSIIICFLIFLLFKKNDVGKTQINTQIIKVTDTIFVPQEKIVEKIKTKYITKFDTIIQIKNDTIIDSVKIDIPITHYSYSDTISTDSTTTNILINFEGYKSKINSIELQHQYFQKNTTITKFQNKKINTGLTFNVGVGYAFIPTTKKFEPFLGVSVGYGLTFNFKK